MIPIVAVLPTAHGSRAMPRPLSIVFLAASLFAMSSCCLAHRWNHSINKVTIDYNSYLAPSISFEQDDHLPYPPAQVGYYRWMYDKDPGHQLAALGPVSPPACDHCGPAVPPPGQPYEYQVLFPAGVPGETGGLWNSQLPQPINVPPGAASSEMPGSSAWPQNSRLAPSEPAPIVPPIPAPVNEPPLSNPRQPPPAGTGGYVTPPAVAPPRLPTFDAPAPSMQPLDNDAPPVYGPSGPPDAGVHLTTGQATRSNPLSAPDTAAAWPNQAN
jgi:hypothetical protein